MSEMIQQYNRQSVEHVSERLTILAEYIAAADALAIFLRRVRNRSYLRSTNSIKQ